MPKKHMNELTTFSFFVAVASIIATVVYGMLEDPNLTNSNVRLMQIQNEYVFIAVFSLFMAMSFALGYVYAREERLNNIKMNKIAGAFLDAFLALSVSVVIARYLFNNPEDFVNKLSQVIIAFSVAFFLIIYSIYRAEGLKPRLSHRLNLSSSVWEDLGVGISLVVFLIVWFFKLGIFVVYLILVVILGIVVLLMILLHKAKSVILGVAIVSCYIILAISSVRISLIPGFLLMFFIKLFLDDVIFGSSEANAESSGDTKATTENKTKDTNKD
ncbi:MAG TPA: hypothetical protein HA302_08260 [Thermococcaceae archaeon]|nr:hypothetical protein [Thermococcaceae archaeon]